MHSQLWLHSRCNHDGQTVLADCFYTPPVKILTIPYAYQTVWPRTLQVIQMSASPGLFNGDRMDIKLQLDQGSRLQLSTQAFTRVQTMPENGLAQQHMMVTLAADSRLYYLPHPLVLHQHAALEQTTKIHLNDNCVLLWGEIIACGRALNQECWQLRSLSATLQIFNHQHKIISDNIQWQPQQQPLDVLGQMEHYTHQACLYYVHTGHNTDSTLKLTNDLYHHLQADWPQTDLSCLWGVTQAGECSICLRALAEEAEKLQQLLQQAAGWLARQTDFILLKDSSGD